MSEFDNTPLHKYNVGDTYMHNGVEVKIAELLDSEFKGQPMYRTQVGNNKPCMTTEGFIDHCMGVKYGVSFIASAPEELNVGDVVEVMDDGKISKSLIVKQGLIVDKGVDGYHVKVKLSDGEYYIMPTSLRKLSDTASFEGRFGINPAAVAAARKIASHTEEDSDNVKAFKTILNEMAETYKAKDADYGSAYDDGYRLFGHTQLLSRIYEKFSRVKHLLDGNKPNVAENICDTLTDMAVQAICLRMLLQKNDFENVK